LPISSAKRELDTVLLHQIDAAYTFVRWAVADPQVAEEVIDEVITRIPRYLEGLGAGNGRVWILRMVRNAVLDRLHSNCPSAGRSGPCESPAFDDLVAPPQPGSNIGARAAGLELQHSEVEVLRRAVADLSLEQREVVLLRDTTGLSYRDITAILAIPTGTMISRLWRARDTLQVRGGNSDGLAMEHEDAPALIDAYVDAEVDIGTAAAFVQHIARCPDCAKRLLNRSRLVQHIRSVTLCRAPDALRSRVQQWLGTNGGRAPRHQSRSSL
jgi:RNA polymerase sigma factor (sigma-70 family)